MATKAEPTPPKETLETRLTRIDCPDCMSDLSWAINPRSYIQDRKVLVCMNNSCKQYGKRWKSPVILLEAE